MRLIGFTGGMGCGKSTAIEELTRISTADIKLVKFAGPLYDIQELIYERIESVHKRPSNFVKDRKLLQWIGTEWGRNTISETLWTDLWKRDVKCWFGAGSSVVCDDVRFDNEAQLIRDMGGIIIQVASSRVSERSVVKGIKGHASENGVKDALIDYEIVNNGSLEDYKISLCKLYRMIGVGSEPQGE